jgi:ABC-type transporter Mla subunit MlaD
MATQDLTPQLRTRLSRLERLVGMFVVVAVVFLLAGLAYYVYKVAERKGWFVRKLPFFTFVNNASGLRQGDPIRLMGFDIGEITEITAQPPFDTYDVFVSFVVHEEFVGYLWDDSRALVASGDLVLAKRFIELTKGTNGVPTYLFHGLETISVAAAESLINSTNIRLAQAVYDGSGTNILARPFRPWDREQWQRFADAGVEALLVFDQSVKKSWPGGIWDNKTGKYRSYERATEKGFFLPPIERPALAARLDQLADTIENALPGILGLTNQINRVLEQASSTAKNADALLDEIRPALRHVTQITANLENPKGSLGEWALPPDLRRQLQQTLASANSLLTNSDQNVSGMSSNVTTVLVNLAAVTSNLNAQVRANSNILSQISSAVTNADNLMQGLKRHWLLRSAFKEPPARTTPTKPPRTRAGPPR